MKNEVILMFVKKCNLYLQHYDILIMLVDLSHDFGRFFRVIDTDPDLGGLHDTDTDPDPDH